MRRDARDHSLADAHAQVDALAPALRAAAARPSPDVVKRRLDALDEDLPRRREWAAAMQAEAERDAAAASTQTDWEEVSPRWKPVLAILAIAFVLWIGWNAGRH